MFKIIFSLLLISTISLAYDEQLDEWAQSKFNPLIKICVQKHAEYKTGLRALEDEFAEKIKALPEDRLSTALKRDPDDGEVTFASFAKEIWPYYLPDSYKLKVYYTECAVHLSKLHKTMSKEALSKWKSCLSKAYEGDLPEASKLMLSCYEKVAK